MTDLPVSIDQIRDFLCPGADQDIQRCRVELWGAVGLILGAAGMAAEHDRDTAARMVRATYAALQMTGTYEAAMIPLFEGAMRTLPKPDPDVVFPTPGEEAAFQGLATTIIQLVWTRDGEPAAAKAWWRLYPRQTPPWRLSPEEQARQVLPN